MKLSTNILKIMVALLLFSFSGCSPFSKMDQKTELEGVLGNYMQCLRWQDYYAAAAFMAEENRASFLEDFTGNEALNITDLKLVSFQPTANPDEYQTLIRMEYFMLPSNTIQKKDIGQTWVLVPAPSALMPKFWQIATPFPEFP